ncbi:MAG: hypothetical protein H6730_04145 [Deltaproteobacteria bacterium]|nr:hypothetical protein [Deltaproteobacteria bacterium]
MALLVALVPTACAPGGAPDGGLKPRDGAPAVDAGELDAGFDLDAGAVDTGAPDEPDAGPAPDQDMDGLPDDQDPSPTRANPVLLRDEFDAMGDWIFSSVSMAIEPQDSLLAVDTIEPFEREGWIGPRPGWFDYLVRSRIRIDAVGTSNDARSGHAGVIARVNQVTPSRYITCGVDLRRRQVVLAEHQGTRRTTLGEAPANITAGAWLLLLFTVEQDGFTCEIDGVRVTGASSTLPSGSVGFRSYDATFAADWIEVYELLP